MISRHLFYASDHPNGSKVSFHEYSSSEASDTGMKAVLLADAMIQLYHASDSIPSLRYFPSDRKTALRRYLCLNLILYLGTMFGFIDMAVSGVCISR